LLRCADLTVGHGGRAILPAISLSVDAGEVFAVIGRNGSGKTTFLRTLLGLLPPVGGQVELAPGLPVTYLAQRSTLDELYPLSALDVVRLGALRGLSFFGRRARSAEARSAAALDELGVGELAKRPYRALSEGQKQRVLLARLVASNAALAVLDEPTSAMDSVAERETMELIARLRTEHGMTILVVSHLLPSVVEHADRALLLAPDEQEVALGTPREVLAHPVFQRRYSERPPVHA
jgi:zinc transport system ATP-binding protein